MKMTGKKGEDPNVERLIDAAQGAAKRRLRNGLLFFTAAVAIYYTNPLGLGKADSQRFFQRQATLAETLRQNPDLSCIRGNRTLAERLNPYIGNVANDLIRDERFLGYYSEKLRNARTDEERGNVASEMAGAMQRGFGSAMLERASAGTKARYYFCFFVLPVSGHQTTPIMLEKFFGDEIGFADDAVIDACRKP